ncbi:MAG TPA: hypothetical protein VKA76_13995, partial [Gammaproteobacteria bacterium]|nr:hypothetical protein [Gammaproteobacteria bacterium]
MKHTSSLVGGLLMAAACSASVAHAEARHGGMDLARSPAHHHGKKDFGQFRDRLLHSHSRQLFGIVRPLTTASRESVDAATAEHNPLSMITLARGLRARVVASSAELG